MYCIQLRLCGVFLCQVFVCRISCTYFLFQFACRWPHDVLFLDLWHISCSPTIVEGHFSITCFVYCINLVSFCSCIGRVVSLVYKKLLQLVVLVMFSCTSTLDTMWLNNCAFSSGDCLSSVFDVKQSFGCRDIWCSFRVVQQSF